MLFPGSRIWYEGTASDLAALTDEIRSAGLSGHILLEFQDSVDVVVCVGGEFQKVIEKVGRRLLSTKKYREIWGKCQIKPGRMIAFELPPPLARRLRVLHGRRLLRSGAASAGCDPAALLAGLKREGFTGALDCVSPEGKILLDFSGGEIVGCWYTEYDGLFREGLGAFQAWHRGYLRSTHPSFFFQSTEGAAGQTEIWEEMLMDSAELVPFPQRSSLERLSAALGREAGAGEALFEAGRATEKAFFILSGELDVEGPTARGSIGPGSLVGLHWISGTDAPAATGRARTPCKYLAFGPGDLGLVFANSPALAARCIRAGFRNLLSLRERLDAYRREPRLRDVESAVFEVLGRSPGGRAAGMSADKLVGELTQTLPLTLPEIDASLRRLADLGRVVQSPNRIALPPEV